MIRWLAHNWLAALGYWFLASCVLAAIIGRCLAAQHPHQHPHRNGAEGANGVGVDQVHAQRGNL